jgi:hypothetical protein
MHAPSTQDDVPTALELWVSSFGFGRRGRRGGGGRREGAWKKCVGTHRLMNLCVKCLSKFRKNSVKLLCGVPATKFGVIVCENR